MKQEFILSEGAVHTERCMDAKRRRGVVGFVEKCYGKISSNPLPVTNLLPSKKAAFTLAEVLITLGIIGVVAALTLPSVIQNYKEKQTVTALKKFYSVLSQAIIMDQYNNPDNYDTEHIISLFKTLKICEPGDKSCAPSEYKFLGGSDCDTFGKNDKYSSYYYAKLVDGVLIRYKTTSDDCSAVRGTTEALQHFCGEFGVDINGDKAPNQVGRDVFYFLVTKYGVIPNGTNDIITNNNKFDNSCNTSNSAKTGYGCAVWVLTNGNMDYLHCNNLSLNGKSSCK